MREIVKASCRLSSLSTTLPELDAKAQSSATDLIVSQMSNPPYLKYWLGRTDFHAASAVNLQVVPPKAYTCWIPVSISIWLSSTVDDIIDLVSLVEL